MRVCILDCYKTHIQYNAVLYSIHGPVIQWHIYVMSRMEGSLVWGVWSWHSDTGKGTIEMQCWRSENINLSSQRPHHCYWYRWDNPNFTHTLTREFTLDMPTPCKDNNLTKCQHQYKTELVTFPRHPFLSFFLKSSEQQRRRGPITEQQMANDWPQFYKELVYIFLI
jgi:hypothetical protein